MIHNGIRYVSLRFEIILRYVIEKVSLYIGKFVVLYELRVMIIK